MSLSSTRVGRRSHTSRLLHPIALAGLGAVLLLATGCPSGETTPQLPGVDAGTDGIGDTADGASDGGQDAAVDQPLGSDLPPADAQPQLPSPWSVSSGVEGDLASCTNNKDDDGNGYTDCNDRNCTDHPYVWVCGALENSPASCSDGVDNAEDPLGGSGTKDGLVDCDDPDCSKNPYLGDVCPSAAPEGYGSGSCGDLQDNDGDGFTDCADLDCLLVPQSHCGKGGRVRILFDSSHGQFAGGADWATDTAVPLPRPSNPIQETDWAGKYSLWALSLIRRGDFVVAALPRGRKFTWQTSELYDLSRFDVVVLPEPSSHYGAGEIAAISDFVRAGGGLLMIGNHLGADRDNNGVDAVGALNGMLTSWSTSGLTGNPTGLWFELVDFDAAQALDDQTLGKASFVNSAGHPVLAGPVGTVKTLGMYVGTTLATKSGGPATPLVWALDPTTPTKGAVAVASEWAAGRIIAVGDSALFSDRTDSHGHADGNVALTQSGRDNFDFALNAMYWLGGLPATP